MRWTSILALCALLAGCGGSAGESLRRVVAVGGFTAVISTSDAWKAEISASPLVVDRIVAETRGSTLWIGIPPGTAARGRWLASQATVDVTLPMLARLDVTDGSRARIVLREPDVDVAVTLTRGSQLAGRLECAGLVIAAANSSLVDLGGTANRVTLAASDRAKLQLTDLATPVLDAVLSGGSTAAVNVSRRLTVEASGGSGLAFQGDARVEQQKLSGGAWLRRE
jgi:hypothetical protein